MLAKAGELPKEVAFEFNYGERSMDNYNSGPLKGSRDKKYFYATCHNNNQWSFKSVDYGEYLCAAAQGNITANRKKRDKWELFKVHKHTGRCYTIQCVRDNKYIYFNGKTFKHNEADYDGTVFRLTAKPVPPKPSLPTNGIMQTKIWKINRRPKDDDDSDEKKETKIIKKGVGNRETVGDDFDDYYKDYHVTLKEVKKEQKAKQKPAFEYAKDAKIFTITIDGVKVQFKENKWSVYSLNGKVVRIINVEGKEYEIICSSSNHAFALNEKLDNLAYY